ncbi:jmjC domain-containing protein 8 isoform X1 [Chiloscyllium punctatum]|uniref:jmjC domain-containing protein 8 isoform X1 n=1 Tax=Chiloscyllium punctatum TaxID=137246 RepID=UPI003B640690
MTCGSAGKSLMDVEGSFGTLERGRQNTPHRWLTTDPAMWKYAYSKPVIIRGITQNEQFRALCSKQSLLQEFGNRLVRLSTANTYSYRKVDVPFKEYVEHMMKPQSLDSLGSDTFYFFGDNNFTEWDSLFRTYIQPPYQLPGTTGAYSFGIAGSGTGVPFHWHGAGYSEVIYGRKRWFLYPPEKTPEFHPNRTTLSWIFDTYPYLSEVDKPLECTIHPGEVSQNPCPFCTICNSQGGQQKLVFTTEPSSSSPERSQYGGIALSKR